LQYEKFQFDEALTENLLDEIKASGIPVAAMPLGFTLPDPEDEKFLEAAIAGRIACLVTGNSRHYKMPKSVKVKIVTPAEFILLIAGKDG
jgi:predicted nucleic acid-binding protein